MVLYMEKRKKATMKEEKAENKHRKILNMQRRKMVSIEFRESISEVLDILNHMDKIYTDKIPKKFKEFLNKNRLENYIPNIDHSKKLNEINLKPTTKDILAVIYINYWCTDEEKIDYIKQLNENQKKYQEELIKKYNPNNIFKKGKEIQENDIKEELAIATHKETIYKKIINKIKSFFRK